jgi:uncharacterized protein
MAIAHAQTPPPIIANEAGLSPHFNGFARLAFVLSLLANPIIRGGGCGEAQDGPIFALPTYSNAMSQPLVCDRLNPPLVHWLQTQGFDPADLDQRGHNGDTALMLATRMGEFVVVHELLEAGATVNVKNNDGNNALWFACFRDFDVLIDPLVEAGIDLDNQNDNGATVLMYAASAGKTEMVKRLLAAGADSQLTNLDDFRAIDFAANREILGILKHGVI